MSGTIAGGKKARDKNLARDPLFYSKIGSIGGANGHTGGFAYGENGRKFGSIGGSRSRRGYKFIRETTTFMEYIDKSNGDKVKFYKVVQ